MNWERYILWAVGAIVSFVIFVYVKSPKENKAYTDTKVKGAMNALDRVEKRIEKNEIERERATDLLIKNTALETKLWVMEKLFSLREKL